MNKKKASGGRFSARRKQEAVMRLLRGEDLETLSRELGVTAGTVSQWREQFLAGGQGALHSRGEWNPVVGRDRWYCEPVARAIPGRWTRGSAQSQAR